MIPKQLNEIGEEDLLRLIGVGESRQLEFKENLGAADEDIKEFLKDLSAMANATGGDVIYGVVQGVDANGNTVATSVDGLPAVNADDFILRLENLIRDCIKPRLLGFGIQSVLLQNGNTAFVVRVPRSWNPPHVVDRRGHWRFYYRDTAGTHPMDVTELRHAMTFGETLAQRLEEFRLARLATIAGNQSLGNRAKLVVHLQPLSSADPESPIDIGRIGFDRRKLMLMPNTMTEAETRLNFEGLLAYNAHNASVGYLQVFRNGNIEVVDTTMPLWRENAGRLPMREIERSLMNAVTRCLGLINDLGRISPVRLHLSLLSVNNYRLEIVMQPQDLDWLFWHEGAERHPIVERDLLLPNLLINEEQLLRYANLTVPADDRDEAYNQLFRLSGSLMRPLFDIVWNAGGFAESVYFDQQGVWTGQIRRG